MTSPSPPSSLPAPDASGSQGESGATPASPAPSAPPQTAAPAAPAPLTKDSAAALQRALRAEHAAIWAYALVAGLDPDDAAIVATMRDAHLVRRDDAAARMVASGQKPAAPAPDYEVPKPVTDKASALALAQTIEIDCASAWLGVVGSTDDADLRNYALAGLTDAALRLTTWKGIAKVIPRTIPFPGRG